jgi:transposase-like protein
MSSKRKSRGGRPSKWPPEFRRDAVAMVLDDDRPIADVARSVGVNAGTLGNWVGLERVERGERDGLTTEERSDLCRSANGQRSSFASTRTCHSMRSPESSSVGPRPHAR